MDFRQKIRTAPEIKAAIAGKTSVLCHGTFDVVHPGHIRHLLYAKSKADILIASLTADDFVAKGATKPYITEELRAQNLAVMEMVDYVLIDRNPTPLENIAYLQPSFFAKGYEYDSELTVKTKAESELVQSYGGQMLFTPGDIVYSSTELQKISPPRLGIEKLLTLMEAEGVSWAHLHDVLDMLAGVRVHVVGDTIVDSYTYTTQIGAMGKTPTISVRYDKRDDYVGGAAIVAKHLKAAGADVHFTTVLGSDAMAGFVDRDLMQAGIHMKAFQDGRMTTNKNVIISGGYRMLKVDKVDNRTVNENALRKICGRINDVECDAVIFSDFRHGIFNGNTIGELAGALPDVFTAADSQVASRWGNILDFEQFDLITPNEREARFALGDQDSGLRPLALQLHEVARCGTLILKCGEAGTLTVKSHDNEDFRSSFALDSFAGRAVDAVGAGDGLLAYSSLALKVTGSPIVASILGAIAAGIECEHDGNVPIPAQWIHDRLTQLEKTAKYESC